MGVFVTLFTFFRRVNMFVCVIVATVAIFVVRGRFFIVVLVVLFTAFTFF